MTQETKQVWNLRADEFEEYWCADKHFNLYEGDEMIACGIDSKDKAEFIQRACNVHDELVEAATIAEKELSYILRHLADQQPRETIPKAWFKAQAILRMAIEQATTKARGEP